MKKLLRYLQRFFLAAGMLGLLWAGLLAAETAGDNASLDRVTGTVVDYEQNEYDYYFNDRLMHAEYRLPVIEYEYCNRTYTDTATTAEGMDIGDVKQMELGDTAVFYTRPHLEHLVSPREYGDALLLAGIAAVVLLTGCGALRGYKERVLKRYPKLSAATGIAAVSSLIFVYLRNRGIGSTVYGGFMPGLDALGDWVMMWAAVILIQLVLLVIWVVMLIKTARRSKKQMHTGKESPQWL